MIKSNVVSEQRTPCSGCGCKNKAASVNDRGEPLCRGCDATKSADSDRPVSVKDLGSDPKLINRHK